MQIIFEILGKPATAGNKRGLPYAKAGGGLGVRMVEGNTREAQERASSWRSVVQDAAAKAMRDASMVGLFTGPLRLHITFCRPRPAGHFNSTGGLSKAGRECPYPVQRPDTVKLTRAIEDAMTGIVWADDSQVVDHVLHKRWCGLAARWETNVTVTVL